MSKFDYKIKEGDFALIKFNDFKDCVWIYVNSVEKDRLLGTVVKNKLTVNIYPLFEKYIFSHGYCNYEKIINNKEIEELSFIYKFHLLKGS